MLNAIDIRRPATEVVRDLLERDDAASTLDTLGFRDGARAARTFEDLVVPTNEALPEMFLRELVDVPDPTLALNNYARLVKATFSRQSFVRDLETRPDVCRTLLQLLGSSQFLADILVRYPAYLYWLVEGPERIATKRGRPYLDREISQTTAAFEHADRKMDALRRLIRRELLRIGAADLLNARPIYDIADELSDLADACLDCVIATASEEMESRFGIPTREDGTRATFCVIGLGKLGGQELNFSSDIDLMFVYSDEGKTRPPADGKSVSHQEYFTRLSERILQIMAEPTQEGFLYRVDMRLRPDGASGALTMPLSAYEGYYQRRGELWERQMLIKARPCAGDGDLGERFMKRIKPFVYPGFVDRSPVEEIHRVKRRIEDRIGRKGHGETHLKLRSGGIRDVEFITQCLQLIVGQVHADARSAWTLQALSQLQNRAALTRQQAAGLRDAYLFYRRLEHRLQMMHGLSDYMLPEEAAEQRPLARSLGFSDTGAYVATLTGHLETVARIYEEVFADARDGGGRQSVASLVEIDMGTPEANALLEELGFTRPEEAHRNLVFLAFGHAPRLRGTQARRSFSELVPALMDTLQDCPDPDQGLINLERVVTAYGAGSTLFHTLNENTGLRTLLLKLCAGSRYLVGILVRNPGLLDWLTMPNVLMQERNEFALDAELDRLMEGAESDDEAIRALNGFKNRELLRIGTRDLLDIADSQDTFTDLSRLAEITLERVYDRVRARLEARYGRPRRQDGATCGFTAIGLGKLGGRELNFGSDLDLVFVYDEDGKTDGERSTGNLQFAVELAQGVIGDLERPTPSGTLYPVDARLRPEGGNAMLALSFAGYDRYMRDRASTWERLAYSRARCVAGDVALGKRLVARMSEFVVGQGLTPEERHEIRAIRARMEKEKGGDSLSIKTGPGGIVDVEFLAQALQIDFARRHASVRSANTLTALAALGEAGVLTRVEAEDLRQGLRLLRRVEKVIRRQDELGRTRLPEEERAQTVVARGSGFESREEMLDSLETRMLRVREIFEKHLGKGHGA